jgi:hypothetical protein
LHPSFASAQYTHPQYLHFDLPGKSTVASVPENFFRNDLEMTDQETLFSK